MAAASALTVWTSVPTSESRPVRVSARRGEPLPERVDARFVGAPEDVVAADVVFVARRAVLRLRAVDLRDREADLRPRDEPLAAAVSVAMGATLAQKRLRRQPPDHQD